MLKKIISIENVGPFARLSHQGDEWAKAVAIYGENATGKTHLSAILRAASTGDNDSIAVRRTANSSASPQVELLTDDVADKVVKYDGKQWNRPCPRLLVFNRDFVHENVYVGREIGPDQREQLYELAIGAAAVKAKAAVEAASKVHAEARDTTKTLGDKLAAKSAPLGADVAELEAAAPLLTVPPEHAAEKARLALRQADGGVETAPGFSALPPYAPIEFAALRQLLDRSVETLAKEAEDSVRAHIAARLDSAGEKWLAQGVQYAVSSAECPYCAQHLATSEVAGLFPRFFDEAYKKLVDSIASGIARLQGLVDWVKSFQEIVHANDKALHTWSRLSALPAAPDVSSVDSGMRSMLTDLRKVLEEKRASPLQVLGADQRVAAIEMRAAQLGKLISDYGEWIAQVSSSAAAERANAASITSELADKVRRVELALLRGHPEVVALLGELRASRIAEGDAKNVRQAATSQLEKSAQLQSEKFIGDVNTLLKSFGTTFSLVNLASRRTSARVSADYQILLKSGVSIKASAKAASEPTFDTVLSQGDRSALALAVFVTMVREREDMALCTVVLDDPFTSLDENRRRRTVELVRSLHQETAQVIVLSHDRLFVRDVLQSLGGAIQREIDPARIASHLLPWDAEQACRTDYARRLERLTAFAKGGCHGSGLSVDAAWSDIRPLLEEYLRFRFPLFWEPVTKGNRWLGDFVGAAKKNVGPHVLPLTAQQVGTIEHFKEFACDPHHGGGTQRKAAPSETELRTLAEEVVAFVTKS